MVPENKQFIYLIRPVRPGFHKELTPEEEEIMGRHFGHLKDLAEKKTAILVGPCLDRAFGICIFEADSKEKIMTAELHPFKISLRRKGD